MTEPRLRITTQMGFSAALLALLEGRVLLTGDTLLMRRRPIARGQVKTAMITADGFVGQVKQTVSMFGLDLTRPPRCSVCNGRPIEVDKNDIGSGTVPAHVYETQVKFTRCPTCGHLYWKATHWERIESVRVEMMREAADA